MVSRPKIFMPFYLDAYLADTSHLSTLEHGSYLLILFHYWRTGKRPPDDDLRLSRITRQSVTEWATVSVTVKAFFSRVIMDGEPVLVNTKLEEVMYNAKSRMARQQAASRKANEAKSRSKTRLAVISAHGLEEKDVPETVSESESETVPETGAYLNLKVDTVVKEEKKISPEPKKGPGQEVVIAPVMLFPTNLYETKQEQAGITQAMLDEWIDAYPGVDVWMALKAARAWLMSNKAKRKTKNGMARYLNSWLSRAQDEASKKGTGNVRQSFGEAKNRRFLNGLARAGDSFGGGDGPAEGEADNRGPGKIGDAS